MPWIEVGTTDIYYVEKGSGQPLIFLHGNTSCCEAWWQQFEAFGDQFRVIAYDSINHGHSSNSGRDEDEPDRADELEGFLAAMNISRPIIAGNSMGGNTLVRWATRHPGDALALIPSGAGVAPAGTTMREQRPLDQETLFLPIGSDSLTDAFKASHPRMHERYLRIRSTATRLEAMRYPRKPSEKTLAERSAMIDRVGAITSPMCVVVGALDPAVPNCEKLHELVPGSEYHPVANAPHNVYYEAATEYNRIVGEFLAKVTGRVPAAV
jgi:pimeloyl-ACP methyl ester carboxylesterase